MPSLSCISKEAYCSLWGHCRVVLFQTKFILKIHTSFMIVICNDGLLAISWACALPDKISGTAPPTDPAYIRSGTPPLVAAPTENLWQMFKHNWQGILLCNQPCQNSSIQGKMIHSSWTDKITLQNDVLHKNDSYTRITNCLSVVHWMTTWSCYIITKQKQLNYQQFVQYTSNFIPEEFILILILIQC